MDMLCEYFIHIYKFKPRYLGLQFELQLLPITIVANNLNSNFVACLKEFPFVFLTKAKAKY